MKREAKFNSEFRKWLKESPLLSSAIELKQTTTNSLPFSALAPHQEMALLASKHNSLMFKLIDAGYQNPFDMFFLVKSGAWVVIKYPEGFYVVDIDDFIKERESSDRKSLTEERAKEIATFCG